MHSQRHDEAYAYYPLGGTAVAGGDGGGLDWTVMIGRGSGGADGVRPSAFAHQHAHDNDDNNNNDNDSSQSKEIKQTQINASFVP